ncbi:hypothetical protein HDV05_008541 [Chytridiales sp. JEL 0842]|nr:hypothetical protein HDV05_008541 [Chytridiales sp. JEL 0842]
MKLTLYGAKTSPFVRKVFIVARESGLTEELEFKHTVVVPTLLETEVSKMGNPLGKIPLLLVDEEPVYGSQVICQYLEALSPSKGIIIPPYDDLMHRTKVLTLEALGDGIVEACLALRYETLLRPVEKQSDEWIKGQQAKIRNSVAVLEKLVIKNGRIGVDLNTAKVLDLASISIGCALAHVNFRFPEINWEASAPNLKAWFYKICERSSFADTVQVNPPA